MFYMSASTRKITDESFQTLTIIWRNTTLANTDTITSLTTAWRTALGGLDPTGSTPGSWYTLAQTQHNDGNSTVSAASTKCDAIVTTSWKGQIVRSFTVKDTTQAGLASAIAADSLKYFGVSMPAANVFVSNITIKIKGA